MNNYLTANDIIDSWLIGIAIAVILLLAFAIYLVIYAKKLEEQRKAMLQKLKDTGFKSTAKHKFNGLLVAIDENMGKWFALCNNSPNATKLLPIDKILSVEILKDSEVVMQSKSGSAAVGGVLFGGVGAMVGASGSRRMDTTVTKLGVRVIFDDLESPMFYIDCLTCKKEIDDVYAFVYAIAKKYSNFD